MNTFAQPSHAPSADPQRLNWRLFLLPILGVALFRDLWAPDEPRYAMIARWIYDHGEFLVLRRCGDLYPDKPPLAYWLFGLLGWLSDWSVPAMRLVSILAIAGVAWFTERLGELWLGPREARWAPILFVGFALILWNGGRIALDPLLTFGCVGALYFAERPAGDVRAANRDALIAGALLGVGMLSKGPVALINTGLPLVAWSITRLRTNGPRASRAVVALALVLAIAPVALWAVAASLREPALWRPLFFGQHIERAAKGVDHHGPPWQNILQVPLLVLPWSAPVLFGFVDGYRAWRARRSGDARAANLARIWLWALVLFVFFSIIPAKRELYLMSAYPAFALLGAQRMVRAFERAAVGARAAALPLALFAAMGVALAIGAPLAEQVLARESLGEARHQFERMLAAYPGIALRGLVSGAVFLVGAALGWRAWRARKLEAWASTVAVTWALGVATTGALLLPVNNVVKSDRELAATLAAQPKRPESIPFYDTNPEGPRFYGAGPCVRAEADELLDGQFEARATQAGDSFLAVVRETSWLRKPAEERARFREIARIRVGSRPLIVIGAGPTRQ